VTSAALTEYNRLCEQRQLAMLRVVVAAQTALFKLNLNDTESARQVLERNVLSYREVDSEVGKFLEKHT
jgi:hypothetical protein